MHRLPRPTLSRALLAAALAAGLALAGEARAAELVLNEWNAVAPDAFLNGGNVVADADGGTAADPFFGRVLGNGGDWLELVVVGDHLDLRGWSLVPIVGGVPGTPLVLSDDPVWADVRAGTLVTIAEDVPDDAGYDPVGGDWWIHAGAGASGSGTLVSAVDFDVDDADWQLRVLDDAGATVFGPAGEGVAPQTGVDDVQVGALAAEPDAWTAADDPGYAARAESSFGTPNRYADGRLIQSLASLRQGLPGPDRDGDGIPDDADASGVVGDAACTGGTSEACDDNCPLRPNPLQADAGGVGGGGPDGVGDACQCGDVTLDQRVDALDVDRLQSMLAQPVEAALSPAALERCAVVDAPDRCDLLTRVVLGRALADAAPGIAPVCAAVLDPDGGSAPAITSLPANQVVAGETYAYAVTAEDPDAGDTVTFSLALAPPGASIDPDTGVMDWVPGVEDAGEHVLRVRATDGTGRFAEQSFPVEVVVAAGDFALRVNAGGPAFTDSAGRDWVADTGFNTGSSFSTSDPIAGTPDPLLYQSERWDAASGPELLYSFAVDPGRYAVRLHFAEIFSGAASPGLRVFDVLLEGETVLDDLDVTARVGAFTALVEAFEVDVLDGSLEVELLHGVQNPKINGLEVVSIARPAQVVATPAQIAFGHVAPGASSDPQVILLENRGPVTAQVEELTFALDAGVGHDFIATLDGVDLAGGHDTVSHGVDASIPVGQTLAVPVRFQVTEVSDNSARLEFGGNFETVSVPVTGTGGETTGDPFLHVVITAPPVVVDYDGDGSEDVFLEGSFSHTHEPGHALASFEWRNHGVPFATQPDLTNAFALGDHDLSLTITDDNDPPRTLTGHAPLSVVPPDAVPGALALYYQAGEAAAADLLDALPGAPDHVEQLNGLSLASAALSDNVVVRFLTTLEIPANDTYTLEATGGVARSVRVDGAPVSGPVALDSGPHILDVRFALDSAAQLPLVVQLGQGGGAPQPVDPAILTHDLSNLPPVINAMSPTQGSELGGNAVEILGLGFFLPGDVVVHWGGAELSGDDLVVEPDRIQLASPPGTGLVSVSVETPRGVSNPVFFQYDAGGPLPIDFTLRDLATDIPNPTTLALGPDERLYVGTQSGDIHVLTLDDDYAVVDSEVISTVAQGGSPHVLGLGFNAFDPPSPVQLYVSHNLLFANGGACFSGFSPYSGRVSRLTGPLFDASDPLITELPVSNHDHGVNGLAWDHNGDLYVNVGGNTNAGVPACTIGDLPESPFSAATLRAATSRPDFDGDVIYLERDTGLPNHDQVFGDLVEVADGVDVEVYAPGQRNPYDLVFTTAERLYSTDNGPNAGFGAASTGPDSQGPDPTHPDELNLLEFNRYYGHPNRNRGLDDPRQTIYSDNVTPSVPGVFTQTLTSYSPSTNGIVEYRANTFNGAMRGHLLAQKHNGVTRRIELAPDGRSIVSQTQLPVSLGSLDLETGPGGVLFGAAHGADKVVIAEPAETVGGLRVHDITPWRAPAAGGHPFVIGGHGFGSLVDTSVTIGGIPVTLTEVGESRIRGLLPSVAQPSGELLDVAVTVGGETRLLEAAYRPLLPPGSEPHGWRFGPELPVALGEVAAGVVDGVLYLVGEGDGATLAYDIDAGTWSTPGDLAARPFEGHHHAALVLDGRLYLFGGLGHGSAGQVQIYDPVADAWSLGAPMPWSAGSVSAVEIAGLTYVCGGIVGNATVDTCGRYDPVADTWAPMASMPAGRNHAAFASDGQRMWVIGGRGPGSGGGNFVANGFDDVQVYDPASDDWEWSGDLGSPLAPLPQARGGTGTAVFFEGEIYVMGGETVSGAGATPDDTYDRLDIYDPVANSWRQGPPMPTGRHGIYPVLYEGQLYLPGGGHSAGNAQSTEFAIHAP